MSYDVKNGRISQSDFGCGYATKEFAVTLLAHSNFSIYKASYWHCVNADVQVAGSAVYDTLKSPEVAIEVGAKKYLDNAAFVKAKINNNGVLSLGYTQFLHPGVKGALGLAINTRGLQEASNTTPAHKFGMSMQFES